MKSWINRYSLTFIIVTFILVLLAFLTIIRDKSLTKWSFFRKSETSGWMIITENAVAKYSGSVLSFPHTDSISINEREYRKLLTLPLKIVAFLDGDCSTCLLKIDFWKEFSSEVKVHGCSIPIVVYAYSTFEENLREYMSAEWNGEYTWLFDRERKFISENELYDLRLQTVLVDGNNKILLIGDPLLNPILRKLYIDTIISFN